MAGSAMLSRFNSERKKTSSSIIKIKKKEGRMVLSMCLKGGVGHNAMLYVYVFDQLLLALKRGAADTVSEFASFN
jgi:hypothetical protein